MFLPSHPRVAAKQPGVTQAQLEKTSCFQDHNVPDLQSGA